MKINGHLKPKILGYEPDAKNGILTTECLKNVNIGSVFEYIPNYQPRWYERLLLRFVKPYYSIDHGYGKDKGVLVISKVLFGKTYIVETLEIGQ